jgi:molybdopterin-containing oxidoreductase family iron-sulfur binding subunit
MEKEKKQYWKGVDQLTNHPEFVKHADKEFPDYLPYNKGKLVGESGGSRRDFLKMMGFSIAAASLASCEAPVRRAIPYLNKPVEITPGIPNYYATSYVSGGNFCSVVVKTREGRPIKIEPNKLTNITGGGATAQAQASVLSLYDTARLRGPYQNGEAITWEQLDAQVKSKLDTIAYQGGDIVLVSRTIFSPTTLSALEDFKSKYPAARLVMYDPISAYGITKANETSFGSAVIPFYHFDKANTIVSFSCDFLGTWINPLRFSSDFATNRKLNKEKKTMSRLYQYESNLSLTGANADYRIPVRASKEGLIVAKLYNLLAGKAGAATVQVPDVEADRIEDAAAALWKERGSSIVVSGSNDPAVQTMVNAINSLLGNYGNTLSLNTPIYMRQGNDEQMKNFVQRAAGGNVDAVIFMDCNPVYDHYLGEQLKDAFPKISLKVSTSPKIDETAKLVDFVAPENHYLESWNDYLPVAGFLGLSQPTITPLFNTRPVQESLLAWAGNENPDYFEYLKASWQQKIFTTQTEQQDFQTFWDECLYKGFYEMPVEQQSGGASFGGDVRAAASAIGDFYESSNSDIELVLYEKISIGDGTQANNPWLQEMPDPISKACWTNYLTISQGMAHAMDIEMFDGNTVLVELTVGEKKAKIPAIVQPGQAEGTVGLALGYGRSSAGIVADNVGVNAFMLMRDIQDYPIMSVRHDLSVTNTGETARVPQTQTHETFMNRGFVIQEALLTQYQESPDAGRHKPKIHVSENLHKQLPVKHEDADHTVEPKAISLWNGHNYPNHHWGMTIDLNSCIGCGACTIACQAENNIPVVGPEEVLMRREMHWLRIDRYYSSQHGAETNKELEKAAENPEVTFQPMLCQQCNNAPCETVCPVAATTHSTEGLNQMTYNRCIGTRYCANNCPYKVRRFNWFKYHDNEKFENNTSMNNDLGKMVLNPDVTVRSRGVMEKCTFCVQRIQYAKLEAKKDRRKINDGEVNPACANTCPTNAIVFGDMNDPGSRVVEMLQLEDAGDIQYVHEPRAYHVLEEINVRPNIWYFTKIRNKDEENA